MPLDFKLLSASLFTAHFPPSCRPTAQWMFLYLDTDSDSQLTQRELYAVERDEHEPCLRPFLDNCDLNRSVSGRGRGQEVSIRDQV